MWAYIYWKGHQVEHYEIPWAYTEEAHKSAIELARRCQILESKGIEPTVNSAIWRWEESENSQSGEAERIVVA